MVDFVSSNTAIDAYNKGVKRGDDRLAALTREEREFLETAKKMALLPTEIETAKSNNRLTRIRADTAEKTQRYDVQNAANTARSGGARADIDVATSGDKIKQSGNVTRAGSARADVEEGTVTPRISQQESAATTAKAGAKYAGDNAYLGNRLNAVRAETAEQEAATKGFHKSLDLYLAGQYDAGDEVLARYGEPPLPDELKRDVQTLRQIKAVADEAQLIFPGNPAGQQKHIEAKIAEMGSGSNRTDPAFPHTLTEGSPRPPSFSGKRETDAVLLKRATDIAAKESGSFPTPGQVQERAGELFQQFKREQSNQGRIDGAFEKAPAVEGSGTREDPYRPRSTEEKNSLPSGTLYTANGQIYRKK